MTKFWWFVIGAVSMLAVFFGSATLSYWLRTRQQIKFVSAPTFDTSGTANIKPPMKIASCSNGSVSWPARSDGCHAEDAPKVYTLDQAEANVHNRSLIEQATQKHPAKDAPPAVVYGTGEFSKAFAVVRPKGLTYHPVTIADMIATDPANWTGGMRPINKIAAVALAAQVMHTHITVEGWLTYFAHEADGDIHLRLCDAPTIQGVDRKHCIVAEIIPELPMKIADALILGKKLRVSGNYRYDAEGGCKRAKPSHCWHEVHPVRTLEIVE